MAHKLLCCLCQRSEETRTTGALSTKDEVTAHQNCLLYSSGIYCQNSPQFDDLFGFSVEDVMEEVKRGNKLICNRCKKKGATAGCEVKRCKKSYHYPCAVQDGAKTFEDTERGEYGLYCLTHYLQQQMKNADTANGDVPKPNNPSEAGSSKVSCPTCEKTEGQISLDSLSNGLIMLYCDKHAPPSQQRTSDDDSTAAGPSGCSNHFSSRTSTSKRQLSFNGKHDETPSKRKPECRRRIINVSSDSDENELDSEMQIFAPLETDLDESENTAEEHQLSREDIESPTSGNPRADEDRDNHEDEDESDPESESLLPPAESCTAPPQHQTTTLTLSTQTESTVVKTEGNGNCGECRQNQSPVHSPDLQTAEPSVSHRASAGPSVSHRASAGPSVSHRASAGPSVSHQASAGPSVSQRASAGPSVSHRASAGPSVSHRASAGPSVSHQASAGPSVSQRASAGPTSSNDHSTPRSVTASPPCTSSAVCPASPETASVVSSTPSSVHLRPDPQPSINSASFWKSCNMAGCTQAIFADFINKMKDISCRIESDRASQEDYDLALNVMAASGKLAELVTRQKEELQRKQVVLQKAAAAMEDVISALRR